MPGKKYLSAAIYFAGLLLKGIKCLIAAILKVMGALMLAIILFEITVTAVDKTLRTMERRWGK